VLDSELNAFYFYPVLNFARDALAMVSPSESPIRARPSRKDFQGQFFNQAITTFRWQN